MKKSLEELKALGWLPCEPPRVTIGFRWPYREVVKCQHCNGKGAIFCYDQGYGKAYGQCYRKKCSCRGGQQAEVRLDKEFRAAVQWFKTSEPPPEPFEVHQWRDVYKVIDDPAAYWVEMKTEIASGNVYRLEAVRDDIVKLYELLVLANEEF